MKKLGNKGFTLVEVIASVTIIGILAGSAIYSSVSTFNKAHVDYCNQISDNMVVAARDYFNDFKNVLPNDYGIKSCVNLGRLQSDKYIEELMDYENEACKTETSKVCVLKETNDTFYYSPILDCNKCITENSLYQDRTEAPTIEFTPNTRQELKNKDLDVTIKFNGGTKKIVSYSYQVYKKASSGDVIVKGSTDYKKYNDKDVKFQLNQRGTFYVVATAINEDGTKKTEKSKEFKLDYTLDCNTRKVIEISASGNDEYPWQVNTWNNKTLKVTFKRKSGAVDNYSAKIYKYDCTGKDECKPQTTNMKGSGWVLHKTVEHATKNKTITVGRDVDNAIYVIEVEGYDGEGGLCLSDKGQIDRPIYKQDNTAPTCTDTVYKSPSNYPDASKKGYTNTDVELTATCHDKGGSECNASKAPYAKFTTDMNTDKTTSPPVDNAHNVGANCPKKTVKIDKTAPTCSSKSGGNTARRWVKDGSFTVYAHCSDSTVNGASSTCTKQKFSASISTEGKMETKPITIKDYAGNTAVCRYEYPKYIDKTAPNCGNKSGGNTTWIKNGPVTVGVNCTDPMGSNDAKSGCTKTKFTVDLNSEGKQESKTITIQDKAGNTTQCTNTYNKYIDKTPPSCGRKGGGNTTWTRSAVDASVGCSDPMGSNNAKSGCTESTFTVSLSNEGKQETKTITIRDRAGNTAQCTNTYNKYIDKTPPVCGRKGGENTTWKNTCSQDITIGCTDPMGADGAQSRCTQSTFSQNVRDQAQQVNKTITIRDNAGNTASCSDTWRVYQDCTRPTYTINSGTHCPSGTVGGTSGYQRGTSISITCNDTLSRIQSGSGSFSASSRPTVCIDNAGNQTAVNISVCWYSASCDKCGSYSCNKSKTCQTGARDCSCVSEGSVYDYSCGTGGRLCDGGATKCYYTTTCCNSCWHY